MKIAKPIINLNKIIDSYDAVVVGLRGVLSDDKEVFAEAVLALKELKKKGKKIILNSNSYKRIETLLIELQEQGVPKNIWDVIITAGEIVHYKFKFSKNSFKISGNKYFLLEDGSDEIFQDLDFQREYNLTKADFVLVSSISNLEKGVDSYMQVLEDAAGLSLPLVCVGNDIATFTNGKMSIGAGAIAEQYAVLGGRFYTIGKPSREVMLYSVDNFDSFSKERTLFIGDNITTDIKGANMLGADSLLVAGGIHEDILGDGYIPDVSKVGELSRAYEAYPDYVISNLRW